MLIVTYETEYSRIHKINIFGDHSVYHIPFTITARDAAQEIRPATICLYDICLSSFGLGWVKYTSGSGSRADTMSNRTCGGGELANMAGQGSRVGDRQWLR